MAYTSPGEAIGQGFTQGVTLATAFHQMSAAKKQAAWEKDLKVAEMGLKLVENKNLNEEVRINAFNTGVLPVLKRMGVNMPEMSVQTLSSGAYNAVVDRAVGTVEDMQKGKVDPHVGFNSIVKDFAGALKNIDTETEAQKTQRELVTGAAKGYVTQADEAGKSSRDEEANALKRSTELGFQYANLLKKGTIDLEMAKNDPTLAGLASLFDKGKLSKEEITAVGNIINHERAYLNTKIVDPARRTPVMYADEYAAGIASGYKPTDLQLGHIILPGPNPNPARKGPAARPAAAPAPAAVAPAAGPVAPQPAISPITPLVPPRPSLMGGPTTASPATGAAAMPNLNGKPYRVEPDAGYLG